MDNEAKRWGIQGRERSLSLGRCTENYCGFAAFIFGSEIRNSDEGSKGESAVSLLVAVSKIIAALPTIILDSETKNDSETKKDSEKDNESGRGRGI